MFGTCPILHEVLIEIVECSILVCISHSHYQVSLIWRITGIKGYIRTRGRSFALCTRNSRVAVACIIVSAHPTTVIIVNGIWAAEEILYGSGTIVATANKVIAFESGANIVIILVGDRISV